MKATALLFKNDSGDDAYIVSLFLGVPSQEDVDEAMKSIYENDTGEHSTQTLEVKQGKVPTLISDGDSRHALYVEGKLVEDGSDTDVSSILIRSGVQWNYHSANGDWMEEVLYISGQWPDNLSEVVLDD
jgi:hypothetical protein